jgi:hypothetical protein
MKLMALYLSMEFDLAAAAKVGLVDDSARPLRINDEEGSVIMQVMQSVAERVFKAGKSEVRDPEFDMTATLAIFGPREQGGVEFMPAMLFTERTSFVRAWRVFRAVHDFSYWTSEQKPDTIPQPEWDFRALIWESAIPHGKPPIECSLSFQLSDSMSPFGLRERMGEIPEKIPDYDTRIRSLARLIASHEKSLEFMGDRPIEDFPVQERIKMSFSIAKWVNENLDKIVEEKGAIIRSFLPEKISLDRVLHPMNQAL